MPYCVRCKNPPEREDFYWWTYGESNPGPLHAMQILYH